MEGLSLDVDAIYAFVLLVNVTIYLFIGVVIESFIRVVTKTGVPEGGEVALVALCIIFWPVVLVGLIVVGACKLLVSLSNAVVGLFTKIFNQVSVNNDDAKNKKR